MNKKIERTQQCMLFCRALTIQV